MRVCVCVTKSVVFQFIALARLSTCKKYCDDQIDDSEKQIRSYNMKQSGELTSQQVKLLSSFQSLSRNFSIKCNFGNTLVNYRKKTKSDLSHPFDGEELRGEDSSVGEHDYELSAQLDVLLLHKVLLLHQHLLY